MPQEQWARAAGIKRATNGAKPMDIEEEAANEEVTKEEETITMSAAHYRAMQQALADIQFELANQRRDALKDKLKANEQYRTLQAML